METRVDEIAERIYRLSTFLPQVGPSGFTFNQFLVDADEPLIFHCGQRALFPKSPSNVGARSSVDPFSGTSSASRQNTS
jgi:hypothetical protein